MYFVPHAATSSNLFGVDLVNGVAVMDEYQSDCSLFFRLHWGGGDAMVSADLIILVDKNGRHPHSIYCLSAVYTENKPYKGEGFPVERGWGNRRITISEG